MTHDPYRIVTNITDPVTFCKLFTINTELIYVCVYVHVKNCTLSLIRNRTFNKSQYRVVIDLGPKNGRRGDRREDYLGTTTVLPYPTDP